MDIQAYFSRIGYGGPREATLASLQAICALHPSAIAFENIEQLSRRPVPLDLPSLERKLVGARRGGYCFEHNTLLLGALRALGFEAQALAARVRWGVSPDRITARGHMLLRVETEDGPYVADGGFGAVTLTAPLRLEPGLEQPTPHEPHRLLCPEDGLYELQIQIGEDWRPVYTFTLEPQAPIDIEVASWFASTYPASGFLKHLIAARALPDRRYGLWNTELTTHWLGGPSEREALSTPEALIEAVTERLGIAADPEELARIFSSLPRERDA